LSVDDHCGWHDNVLVAAGRRPQLGNKASGDERGAREADTGAAMVELALVLILLVMLLVGTVTAAVAFGRGNSIQNATREASRFAATLDEVDTKLSQVIDVAKAASSGDLDPSAPGYYVCVAHVDPGGNSRLTEGSPPLFDDIEGEPLCYVDGRPDDEPRVQVTAGRDTTINAIVFSADVTLSAQAAARYER
jgi:Flp pilus assembly protein TadG